MESEFLGRAGGEGVSSQLFVPKSLGFELQAE